MPPTIVNPSPEIERRDMQKIGPSLIAHDVRASKVGASLLVFVEQAGMA
jgi:hypothetical protein